MSRPLVIVESPAKAKTIGQFLGDKYKVMASIGHVSAQTSTDGIAKVVAVHGDARYFVAGDSTPHALKTGMILKSGITIQTASGMDNYVDLVLNNAQAIAPPSPGPSEISHFQPKVEQDGIRIFDNTVLSVDKLTKTETGADTVTDTELDLKTLNDLIQVRKTTAEFEIRGLNGGIDMEDISGSGQVRTLNGKVKVSFSKNPTRKTDFRTLNGSVDVYFQPGLDADLHFRKLNASIYTDFDVSALPLTQTSGENQNGRFVYRTNRSMAGRAGKGGPELTFDTLNGTIRLHSKTM